MALMSSFDGIIEEIPGIAVDNFEHRHLDSRAFFLSHYHMDHVQGLDTTELADSLKKTKAFIYTSEITAIIINHVMKGSKILKYVKPLGRETTLITLPGKPNKQLKRLFVEVTLIPAGHSFGSTMFLFKTTEKTVLYTGDFRIRINDISKYGKLHKNNEPINIDAMYVDTTFLREKYEDFAKRSDTADTVIDEIEKWLKKDKNNGVSIYMYANYTFEFILNKIYQRLKMKVYINDYKWEFYRNILHLVPSVTNDPNETKLHLCSNKYESENHYKCFTRFHAKRSYLHIHLTAQKWSDYKIDQSPISRKSEKCFDACFSTHCSRNEILHFVAYFNPSKIIGFPNEYVQPDDNSDEEFVLTPKKSSKRKRRNDDI
ncbi:PREDICTED: protein artemis-like [Papilio polytes]|uniref:protein artemis-like n=1 Tax=Papilio polytes TaxID=76194 RepID=UPI000676041B|nr:PREDICTED: protein artemis-like [Papilio polytes]